MSTDVVILQYNFDAAHVTLTRDSLERLNPPCETCWTCYIWMADVKWDKQQMQPAAVVRKDFDASAWDRKSAPAAVEVLGPQGLIPPRSVLLVASFPLIILGDGGGGGGGGSSGWSYTIEFEEGGRHPRIHLLHQVACRRRQLDIDTCVSSLRKAEGSRIAFVMLHLKLPPGPLVSRPRLKPRLLGVHSKPKPKRMAPTDLIASGDNRWIGASGLLPRQPGDDGVRGSAAQGLGNGFFPNRWYLDRLPPFFFPLFVDFLLVSFVLTPPPPPLCLFLGLLTCFWSDLWASHLSTSLALLVDHRQWFFGLFDNLEVRNCAILRKRGIQNQRNGISSYFCVGLWESWKQSCFYQFLSLQEITECHCQNKKNAIVDSFVYLGYEDSSGCETMVVHPTFDTENNWQAIYELVPDDK